MAAELKSNFGASSELEESKGGIFDVTVDGKLVFSKHSEGRFPKPGEVTQRLQAKP
ncbi:MAG: SelT/SelW/SelH family protein [Planctomycetes bacterium]|nr:SelT/SelW/SelH family protein [Planctomycetota bacterium]